MITASTARLSGAIVVGVRVSKLGGASMTMEYQIEDKAMELRNEMGDKERRGEKEKGEKKREKD
jgi:hypothetical protein